MRWIGLIILMGLAACATAPTPAPPEQPECAKPEKAPIDGGLGGTGNKPKVDCDDE